MTIAVGDKLPDATLTYIGDQGPAQVALSEKLAGRKVVIFAVPGAFTPTCHSAHMPSFVRTRDGFAGKGVDEVICLSVNDPFVMKAWDEATGASAAGITVLADAEGEFTKAIGMEFSAPPAGLLNRSQRYSLYAEDGVVKVYNPETGRGTCEISGGEALLDAL